MMIRVVARNRVHLDPPKKVLPAGTPGAGGELSSTPAIRIVHTYGPYVDKRMVDL